MQVDSVVQKTNTTPSKDIVAEDLPAESLEQNANQCSTSSLDHQIPLEENEVYEGLDELSQNIPLDETADCALEGTGEPHGDKHTGETSDGQVKVMSDISGRFHIDGAQYQNCSELRNHQEQDQPEEVTSQASLVSNTNPIGEHNYENIYDDVASSGVSRGEAKHGVNVVKPVVNLALTTTVTTPVTTACFSSSSSSVSSSNQSKPYTNTSSASVLTACGVSVPSISDRIISLTNKKSTGGKGEKVSVPVGKGLPVCGKSKNMETVPIASGEGNQLGMKPSGVKTEGLESVFPADASISNKSFKTEAVSGAYPFIHLEANQSETTPVGGKVGSTLESRWKNENKERAFSQERDRITNDKISKSMSCPADSQGKRMVSIDSERQSDCLWKTGIGRKDRLNEMPQDSKIIHRNMPSHGVISSGDKGIYTHIGDAETTGFQESSYEIPYAQTVPILPPRENKGKQNAPGACYGLDVYVPGNTLLLAFWSTTNIFVLKKLRISERSFSVLILNWQ